MNLERRLTMTKTALILVDIQNDYFPGGAWEVLGMEAAAGQAAHLLAAARRDGVLVIHVRHEFASAEAPFFRPGSSGAEIHASVAPTATETVLTKARPNAFVGTALLDLLQGGDIQAVTLCGAMTQMCIDATARAAADLGFAVTVAADACAARAVSFDGQDVPAEMVHAAFLAPLAASYGRVVPVSTLLD